MWQERADYGHFFYRIPNGESAADAYDRVSGFNESLWRSFGEDDFASVCVLVTHGLMTRVFLMKWYHWSVEYFEDLRNVNHCEFIVMARSKDSGKYVLKNKLRTWTEFKRERADEQRLSLTSPTNTIPVRKRWGGCPDGCDHHVVEKKPPQRQNTADLFRDESVGMATQIKALEEAIQKNDERKKDEAERGRHLNGSVDDSEHLNSDGLSGNAKNKGSPKKHRIVSPNRLAVLQAGRDGGGSRSGNASRSGSDDDETGNDTETEAAKKQSAAGVDAEERRKQFRPPRSMALALNGTLDGDGGLRTGTMADALGDQSDMDEEDLLEADMEGRVIKEVEQSVEGSVM